MDKETIELVRYGIDSAFWLAVIWIAVRGVQQVIVATKISSKF